jgi:hypothetical protein
LEGTIGIREPTNRKAVDSEVLDDLLLVALAKDFVVDHPSRSPLARRALDEFHGLTSEKEKGMRYFASL